MSASSLHRESTDSLIMLFNEHTNIITVHIVVSNVVQPQEICLAISETRQKQNLVK